MADCNESPIATNITESQECTTAEVADDEPGPPPYSFGHQNISEKNISSWPAHGDDFEQEGFDYNDTEVNGHDRYHAEVNGHDRYHAEVNGHDRYHAEVNGHGRYHAEVNGRDRYHAEVNEHDQYHTEVNGREQYHAELNGHDQYHSEVNAHDRYYAASSRLYKGSHKTYNDDPHYSSRRHERWQEPPRYPYPDKSFPRNTHPDKPYPGRARSGKPYPGRARSGKTYPGQAHPAQIQRLDHANSRIYFDASQLPHQDQILSLIGAEQQDSPQLNIVRVINVQAPKIKSYLALSICVTLCCCLPLGIFAILSSHKVITSVAKSDYTKAKTYSKSALILNIMGIAIPILFVIIGVAKVLSQK